MRWFDNPSLRGTCVVRSLVFLVAYPFLLRVRCLVRHPRRHPASSFPPARHCEERNDEAIHTAFPRASPPRHFSTPSFSFASSLRVTPRPDNPRPVIARSAALTQSIRHSQRHPTSSFPHPVILLCLVITSNTATRQPPPRHCEERSDKAIHTAFP